MNSNSELQMNTAKVGAVLLAAGSASRMGNRPKCLLERDGVPLIRRLILALHEAGVGEVVVVLGHYADRIVLAVQDLPVRLVRNPQPEDGQISSLHLGLRALSGSTDAVLVALADQALIDTADLQDLLQAYRLRPQGAQVVQPSVEGLPGNPVVFSDVVRQQILAGGTQFGCRQWQVAHPEQSHAWVCTNPHYRADVDTQQDVEALAQSTGIVLQWPADLSS